VAKASQDRQDFFKMMGITPATSADPAVPSTLSSSTVRMKLPSDPTIFWRGKAETGDRQTRSVYIGIQRTMLLYEKADDGGLRRKTGRLESIS
jgi:hypothetical protein